MQGFNMGRYHPPDGSSLQKPHAGTKHTSRGLPTIRFEMPFPIWCTTCPKPTIIGQGVRFNATKQRTGNYHTTPIWSFTLKHTACGGEIIIRTDPANTDYVVVSGGKRRDTGLDDDSLVSAKYGLGNKEEEREKAFGVLEKTILDRERMVQAGERIGELVGESERRWEDPYAVNQRLRKEFRVGRKEREREAQCAEEVSERLGLGIEVLPGTEEDARRAGLVDFGQVEGDDGGVDRALKRGLFEGANDTKTKEKGKKKKLKADLTADRTRQSLADEVVGNTRAAKDPFLAFGSKDGPKGAARIPGLKRKRPAEGAGPAERSPEKVSPLTSKALVEYGSDSD
ncbi:hypothetical protein OQA88_10140 [Cercophora sp. LCS_1]